MAYDKKTSSNLQKVMIFNNFTFLLALMLKLWGSPMLYARVMPLSGNFAAYSKAHSKRLLANSGLHEERQKEKIYKVMDFFFFPNQCIITKFSHSMTFSHLLQNLSVEIPTS